MGNLLDNRPELFYGTEEKEKVLLDLNNIKVKAIGTVIVEEDNCPALSISFEGVEFERLIEELIGVLGYDDLMRLIDQAVS